MEFYFKYAQAGSYFEMLQNVIWNMMQTNILSYMKQGSGESMKTEGS